MIFILYHDRATLAVANRRIGDGSLSAPLYTTRPKLLMTSQWRALGT